MQDMPVYLVRTMPCIYDSPLMLVWETMYLIWTIAIVVGSSVMALGLDFVITIARPFRVLFVPTIELGEDQGLVVLFVPRPRLSPWLVFFLRGGLLYLALQFVFLGLGLISC